MEPMETSNMEKIAEITWRQLSRASWKMSYWYTKWKEKRRSIGQESYMIVNKHRCFIGWWSFLIKFLVFGDVIMNSSSAREKWRRHWLSFTPCGIPKGRMGSPSHEVNLSLILSIGSGRIEGSCNRCRRSRCCRRRWNESSRRLRTRSHSVISNWMSGWWWKLMMSHLILMSSNRVWSFIGVLWWSKLRLSCGRTVRNISRMGGTCCRCLMSKRWLIRESWVSVLRTWLWSDSITTVIIGSLRRRCVIC